ncbi:hypothetical protein [Micromonospora sp. NPDC004551]|uniref:hypothetical protein n=1 Tax=Micromonospora sp. NPDC004551 TaxID=3154284 RepID=UPI0033A4B8D2
MTDLEDIVHAVDAATVRTLLPARPRVLALGEPTHGEDVLLDLRNDLFRQLVDQDGYRTIAIESDCLLGLAVDDHVTAGTGTLDEVMARGFSHGFGASGSWCAGCARTTTAALRRGGVTEADAAIPARHNRQPGGNRVKGRGRVG